MTGPNRCAVRKPFLTAILFLLIAGLLAGCGGSGGTDAVDAGQDADTGAVYITVTDAEGDFATYTVDITSIMLERTDGTRVETLPNRARIDFTQYVELTEMFTATQIPNGAYVGGAITLDYTNADVQVEVGDAAVPATVVDTGGQLLGLYTLDLRLEDQDRLIVAPGRPALLEIDFDLAASHEVDTQLSPPVVTAAPFLVADVAPVDEKDFRVRGPLVAVDQAGSGYSVRLRPWHRRDGDFGPFTINVTATTEFEIDGISYSGISGLAALDVLGKGAPTIAHGTLDIESREFVAAIVLAGDSVPGHGFDAVLGNVVARQENLLTIRGATIVPSSGSVVFNDEVAVSVGPDTGVTKDGSPHAALDIGDISVGQRIRILGTITSDPAVPGLTMDATRGRARLRITHLSGTANTVTTGLLTLNLHGIDGRRIELFDFTGTGMTPGQDADPIDYEIDTSTLGLGFVDPDTPLRVFGFVNEFGVAPPDFTGRTVIDVGIMHARLSIGWLPEGTVAPFLSIGPDGLVPDLGNPNLGLRHHLKLGHVVIDLTEMAAAPTILPAANVRTRFAIMQGHRVQLFHDFDRFVATLTQLLDGATNAYALHATGRYDRDSNAVHARTISIRLGTDVTE